MKQLELKQNLELSLDKKATESQIQEIRGK